MVLVLKISCRLGELDPSAASISGSLSILFLLSFLSLRLFRDLLLLPGEELERLLCNPWGEPPSLESSLHGGLDGVRGEAA